MLFRAGEPRRGQPGNFALPPVCAACAARHRAETFDPSLTKRAVSRFANFDMVGAMALGVAALFFG